VTDIVQVTTTIGSKTEAVRLAESMVKERLAACAQIQGPIDSVYHWKGSIEHDTEWYCHFKTTKPLAEKLRTRLVSEHPYDVPEVMVVSITDSHPPYAQWVIGETGDSEPDA